MSYRTVRKHCPRGLQFFRDSFHLLLLAGLLGCAPIAHSQSPPPAATAVSAFDPESATHDYLSRVPADQRARPNAYFEGGYWLHLWEFLVGAALAVLLLQTRLSAKMRDLACRITTRKPLQSAFYGILYISLMAALTFPMSVYSDFFREHKYHLANQDFGGWFGDWAKGLLVSVLLGCPLLMTLVGAVRRFPRSWHLWGATVAIAFLILGVLIAPVYIAPLFNKYTPLADAKVADPILRMARANGINADTVYEMDASKQTKRISANVSGMLNTMRITLNDNLLQRCSLPEIEAVMGHEMGHYVMNHVYKLLVFFGVIIMAAFALLRWSLEKHLAISGQRWGISGVGHVAVVPLAVLPFSTYLFLLTPITNTIIRVQEIEADRLGLNAARQPEGFAEVSLKLGEYRKLEPTPIEEWIFFDHPSGATRIRTAMRWKAEY